MQDYHFWTHKNCAIQGNSETLFILLVIRDNVDANMIKMRIRNFI